MLAWALFAARAAGWMSPGQQQAATAPKVMAFAEVAAGASVLACKLKVQLW